MLTSIRGLSAATLSAGLMLSAAPAFASETVSEEAISFTPAAPTEISDELIAASASADGIAPVLTLERSTAPIDADQANSLQDDGEAAGGDLEISGNVALVTDYRFRGISFSDGDPALQGGIDIAHSSGFYVGTWGSSISGGTQYGELELDVYGGWSGDITDGVTFDVGLLYYIYPTENELSEALDAPTDYFEPYASIGTSLGPVSATVGVAYAWKQDSLGGDDNLYLYTDLEAGIPNTPITLTAHLGYTDGVLAIDDDGNALDWGLGASWAITDALSLGVNYVDTNGTEVEDFSDAGLFFTLGYSI